jgi:hypothetical protein
VLARALCAEGQLMLQEMQRNIANLRRMISKKTAEEEKMRDKVFSFV